MTINVSTRILWHLASQLNQDKLVTIYINIYFKAKKAQFTRYYIILPYKNNFSCFVEKKAITFHQNTVVLKKYIHILVFCPLGQK